MTKAPGPKPPARPSGRKQRGAIGIAIGIAIGVVIGIDVTTADAVKKIKLGIYDLGSDGLPANRVLGSSELALDSTGLVSQSSIAQLLDPGWYYLVLRSNSGTAVVTRQLRQNASRILPPADASLSGSTHVSSDTGSYAVDGLPATFPSSPSRLFGTAIVRPMLKTSATP